MLYSHVFLKNNNRKFLISHSPKLCNLWYKCNYAVKMNTKSTLACGLSIYVSCTNVPFFDLITNLKEFKGWKNGITARET